MRSRKREEAEALARHRRYVLILQYTDPRYALHCRMSVAFRHGLAGPTARDNEILDELAETFPP